MLAAKRTSLRINCPGKMNKFCWLTIPQESVKIIFFFAFTWSLHVLLVSKTGSVSQDNLPLNWFFLLPAKTTKIRFFLLPAKSIQIWINLPSVTNDHAYEVCITWSHDLSLPKHPFSGLIGLNPRKHHSGKIHRGLMAAFGEPQQKSAPTAKIGRL